MRRHVRVYRIKPGELDAFVAEWRTAVVPLRRRFGFTVEHAWASVDDDTFVWVVGYDGGDWDAAEEAYYDSDERRALDPDPARRVIEQNSFFASAVPLP
jgi:hypothetical protein